MKTTVVAAVAVLAAQEVTEVQAQAGLELGGTDLRHL
jgi:hypothetical protein